jgi:hypothetical protein
MRIAEHAILDQLTEHYPAHLSKDELTGIVRSELVNAVDVEDALAELLGQRLIHRQGDTDYYWLAKPLMYVRQIGWEPGSLALR